MKRKLLCLLTVALFVLSGCGKKDDGERSLKSIIIMNQRNGNVDLIREFKECGGNLDDFESTAFAAATSENNPFIYSFTSSSLLAGIPYLLILEGADVNGKSSFNGSSLLMNAACNSHYEMCDFLLKEGADINAKDDDGRNAVDSCLNDVINYISWYDRTKTLQLLLDNGAEISTKTVEEIKSRIYIQSIEAVRLIVEYCKKNDIDTGLSEIIEAAVMGNSEKVLSLLNENLPDDDWRKLIPAALAYCNAEVVEKIVSYGYDFVNHEHAEVFPTIHYESDIKIDIAARNGNIDVVKYMYENKLYPMDDGTEQLLSNCLAYDYDVTKYLLSKGVIPAYSWTLLYFPLLNNDYELAEFIISSIEDEETLQKNLDSCLSSLFKHRNWLNPYKDYDYLNKCDYLFDKGASIELQSFYPDIEVCKWLVEHGKSVDANGYSTTSIPLNDVYESAECIQYLIDCGADINAKDINTPLEDAVKYGYYDSVVVLVENGAEIGDSIFTALFGSEKILRYLCENGADLTLVDEDGRTLLERVEITGSAHPKASEILKEYGAEY